MRGWILAIFAALCFGSSPILIKEGLAGFRSPLLGITIAQVFAMLTFGFLLGGTGRLKEVFSAGRKPVLFMAVTGVFLAIGRLSSG